MRVLSAATSCAQLPTFYKFTIFGVLVLILFATLQTGPVDFREHWDKLRKPTKAGLGGGMPLRVMFIGASMTLGEHSTGERGFGKQIRDWLIEQGNEVNYVGQNRYGAFLDNDVQAFGAQPIIPLLDSCKEIVPQTQPNLILINAGSSDCFQPEHFGSALALSKIRALVDYLFEASPRATIILSTVIPSPWDGVEACVRSVNAQIRQAVLDLAREGKRVALAEMHYDQGLPDRVELKHIGKDEMHPTDGGYFIMGDIFIGSIQEVDDLGFLQPPVINGVPFDGEAERYAEQINAQTQQQTNMEQPQSEGESVQEADEEESEASSLPRRRRQRFPFRL
ncbi:SGNH hydrolase-type esterase domain-containing protein [Xylariaceae sp. FL0255]|nr:SGNH hydrolase-type esterase domain-containing protein [Xylariaceae sp. FL0255]